MSKAGELLTRSGLRCSCKKKRVLRAMQLSEYGYHEE